MIWPVTKLPGLASFCVECLAKSTFHMETGFCVHGRREKEDKGNIKEGEVECVR